MLIEIVFSFYKMKCALVRRSCDAMYIHRNVEAEEIERRCSMIMMMMMMMVSSIRA